MINTKRDRKNLFVRLSKLDIITKLRPFLNQGHYHFTVDGSLVPNVDARQWDAPWVYIKPHPKHRCDIGHYIMWKHFKMIPSWCRSCYKVVVRPRTLVELFDLYELMREMGVPCKCGVEPRQTVQALYGGYFYCQGLEEGRERYKQVRKAVDEQISPEVSVILKRYCTEYEIGPGSRGPSNELPDMTDEEKYVETILMAIMPAGMHGSIQHDHLDAYTMKKWIFWAYRYGDPTYKEFTDGSDLFPQTVTYHQEVKEDG